MHDGSELQLHKLEQDWDPFNRISAMNAIQNAKVKDEILTGLIYINPDTTDLHELLQTNEEPLNSLTEKELCPGSAVLAEINADLR